MRKLTLSFVVLGLFATSCVEPTSIVIEPLRIINWSPTGGGFCVGVNTGVSVTFSDDIVVDSLTADSLYLLSADGTVETTLTYDEATFTARLAPAAPLAFDKIHTAVAVKGIEGKNDGRLAANVEASFVTLARNGCTPGTECNLPSDCPDNQICANVGICTDECVTDKDCFRGTCSTTGSCIPDNGVDGGGGDPGPGDPGPGDTDVGDSVGD